MGVGLGSALILHSSLRNRCRAKEGYACTLQVPEPLFLRKATTEQFMCCGSKMHLQRGVHICVERCFRHKAMVKKNQRPHGCCCCTICFSGPVCFSLSLFHWSLCPYFFSCRLFHVFRVTTQRASASSWLTGARRRGILEFLYRDFSHSKMSQHFRNALHSFQHPHALFSTCLAFTFATLSQHFRNTFATRPKLPQHFRNTPNTFRNRSVNLFLLH